MSVTTEPTAAPEPSGNGAAPLLELRDVEAGYGPFRSLFGVSLTVQHQGVTALLGANGSGKTTVVRVASGLVKPTAGSLLFEGEDVGGRRAYKLARLGIVHAPEGRSVFASLSVEENLVLTFRQQFGRRGVKPKLERAYELFPRMGERRRQAAGTLSGGEQRMLSLARVLVREPKMLITDELSLGLAPVIIDEVYATLATIRDSGCSLLVVEQHVHQALTLADDVVVLAKGKVALHGRADELGDISERLLPAVHGELSSTGARRREGGVLEDHAGAEGRLGDLPDAVLVHGLAERQHVGEGVAHEHEVELHHRAVGAGAPHPVHRRGRLPTGGVEEPGLEQRPQRGVGAVDEAGGPSVGVGGRGIAAAEHREEGVGDLTLRARRARLGRRRGRGRCAQRTGHESESDDREHGRQADRAMKSHDPY